MVILRLQEPLLSMMATQSALSAISSAAYVQFPTAIALSSVFNAVTSSPADFPTPITQILAPTSTLASLASVFPSDNVFTYYIIQTNSSSAAGLATLYAAKLAAPSDQVIVPTIVSSIDALATSNAANLATPSDQVIVPTILSSTAALATSNAADLATPSDQVIIPTILNSIAALATSNAADLATPSDQVIVPTIINSIAALATSNAADLGTPSNQVVVPASTLALPRQQQSASLAL
ncbi:uncharacterized protein L3040_003070 [Drepanopeziza brunnea f. sp. 'multigermtubi']|uniref:uncharacterized protein n=1 Tax=Drepanopeziza brunnea f. sp. 'multigermtubi' TaxID=698441 RepID=UPI00239C9D06|nr:hypothetical protein L3040_003070 [Drepanopeziza brunnea f. sp. 'multigermtubi']